MRGVPIGATVGLDVDDPTLADWRADIARCQEMGLTSVRVGISPWSSSPGQLAVARGALQVAVDAGMSVMLTCSQLVGNVGSDDERVLDTATPRLIADAVAYVDRAAAALGDLVTWWQVSNEHDARDWRDWDRRLWDETAVLAAPENQKVPIERARVYMTPHYLETLRDVIAACAERIRARHPSAIVLTATTGVGASTDAERIWRRFYDVVGPVVDAVGINLYPIAWWQKYLEMPARLRRTAVYLDRPIYLTEIGLPTLSMPTRLEEGELIAAQVDRGTRSADVAGLWLYQLRDAGPAGAPEYQTNPEHRFGLYEHDGTMKPAAYAVRAMIATVTT